jgi:hypothetical protein
MMRLFGRTLHWLCGIISHLRTSFVPCHIRHRPNDARLAAQDQSNSYRLIVQRQSKNVLLLSRNRNDWSGLYL